jgi:hypothetical protein
MRLDRRLYGACTQESAFRQNRTHFAGGDRGSLTIVIARIPRVSQAICAGLKNTLWDRLSFGEGRAVAGSPLALDYSSTTGAMVCISRKEMSRRRLSSQRTMRTHLRLSSSVSRPTEASCG